MSKPDLYSPIYYILKFQDNRFDVFNRATDAAILQECDRDSVIDFLNMNDPFHPFLSREAGDEAPAYGTPEWSYLWKSGVTSYYIGAESFNDVFTELERSLDESLIEDYEINGTHCKADEQISPYTYTFEFAAYRPDATRNIPEATTTQLEFDFDRSGGVSARASTSEAIRLQLQEDIFDEDEDDLEYLPED